MRAKRKQAGRGGRRVSAGLRERVRRILEALHRAHPAPRVELDHRNPFELLVATILSAQCTDARVNQVTRELFRRYPGPADLARARVEDLEEAIRSTGFFRSKARSIRGCCREIVERHGGSVPRTMEELVRLPGVGRKTANVVLGAGYGIPSGIVVDTHMSRVARRLGLTRRDDPVGIEDDLVKLVPQAECIFFSIAMILHGRYVCLARRPRCGDCPLNPHCPSRHLGAQPRPAARLSAPAGRPGRRPPRPAPDRS